MMKFGLFLKLVPSLVIDVVDILFDTMYFSEIVRLGKPNRNFSDSESRDNFISDF